MKETVNKLERQGTVEIARSEWEQLRKFEASYKLTQKYVGLLEGSNKQLDQKIIEQSLLNEIAKAFSSTAYDQWNIAGLIFSLLKKKANLTVFALLLMGEEKPALILASDRALSSEVKSAVRLRALERYAREAKTAIDPASITIMEQILTTEMPHEENLSIGKIHTSPLAIYKESLGVMGIGLAGESALTVEDESFFRILATQLALFIENDRIRQTITNEKNKLEALSKELARSNQELEQFAYVASHDLQEPLRMVASYTQLLAKRYQGKLDKDADEFIGFAVDGAKRMQQLIGDLLEYSRVGRKGKELKRMSLEPILDSALANLKVAIDEAKAVVTRDPVPEVMADDVQLARLFQNLIGNAIKFRRPDEPPNVHVSAERKDNEWILSIHDNGIGIDPKHFDRLFIIFQRLHTREEYPGTGIGLAVCKKIVERHGGRIWVKSEPEKGTMFYFTMPVCEEKEEGK